MKKKNDITVKELKQRIRWANVRITELYEKIAKGRSGIEKTEKQLFDRRVQNLQSIYGEGRYQLLKLGFRGKRKSELETQLSMFESFADYLETAPTKTKRRKYSQTHGAYKTLKSRYGFDDLTYSEYKDLVTVFAAVGDKILNQYGSLQIVELYEQADKQQRENFVETMIDVLRDSKGQGWTSEQLYDEMLFRLTEEQEQKAMARRRRKKK